MYTCSAIELLPQNMVRWVGFEPTMNRFPIRENCSFGLFLSHLYTGAYTIPPPTSCPGTLPGAANFKGLLPYLMYILYIKILYLSNLISCRRIPCHPRTSITMRALRITLIKPVERGGENPPPPTTNSKNFLTFWTNKVQV